MNVDTTFVLPEDVRFTSVADMPPALKQQLGAGSDDVAVSRSGTRTAARIVDRDGAALLVEFRTPSTIVDAVVRFSARAKVDARQTLTDAFEMLRACVNAHVLVKADSDEAKPIAASVTAGERIDDFEVVRGVQVLEDTELYQARRGAQVAAIKIARASRAGSMKSALLREAALLDIAAGAGGAPDVLVRGTWHDRPYIAITWRAGSPVNAAADALRWSTEMPDWRARLHALACAVLNAYCELHGRRLIHVDVQPNNILASEDGRVAVIDFGLARVSEEGHPLSAGLVGGVPLFCDPETARALLDANPSAPPTVAGEQYRLGALLYLLLTGQFYIDPPAECDALYQRILEVEPQPFQRRGFEPWPETEAVLRRAMSKRPEDRFPSVAAFRDAFVAAAPPAQGAVHTRPAVRDLMARCVAELDIDGALFREGPPEAPVASFSLGAAGLAYFLYRMSLVGDDPELLFRGDAWSTRAHASIGRPEAFYNEALEMGEGVVRPVSLFHHAPGVHLVCAKIARARGDEGALLQSAAEYVQCAGQPERSLDPTLGGPGALLGAALLYVELPETAAAEVGCLIEHASAELEARINALPPISECAEMPFLGMAHGWTGILYALLRAAQARGVKPSPVVVKRLAELAKLAVPSGKALSWPGSVVVHGHKAPALDHVPGWCAGTAGYVHLFTLANELVGDSGYLDIASRAAIYTAESPDGYADLCCGFAGRAYAVLRLGQATNDARWRTAAEDLATRAAASVEQGTLRPLSLYRGRFGVALLLSELGDPARASAPLHEPPLRFRGVDGLSCA